jgi:hypothetical protein
MGVEPDDQYGVHTMLTQPGLEAGRRERAEHVLVEQPFRPMPGLRPQTRRQLGTPGPGHERLRLVRFVVMPDPGDRAALAPRLIHMKADVREGLLVIWDGSQSRGRELVLRVHHQ